MRDPVAPAEKSGIAWSTVVLAAVLMLATLPGRTQGLGLITEPLLADMGLDRMSYAAINLWATLAGACFCLPAGFLLDRCGLRQPAADMALLLGSVVWMMSRLPGQAGLPLLIFLTRAVGQSALSVASITAAGKSGGSRPGMAMAVYSVLMSIFFAAAFVGVGAMVSARDLSSVFDSFWNSELAFPIGALGASDLAPSAARDRFDALVGSAGAAHPSTATRIDEQLKIGRLDLTFAAVQVFADVPAKAAGAGVGDAAGSAPGPMGTAMQGTLALLRSARSEVLIASPYFIPGQRGLELMREARDDGVRISVLTNSLAATDEPLAHWGYARYRKAMLKMGVDLNELSPTRIRQAGMLGNFSSSLGRLHAKLAVVDRRWLMVGSMNMDLRSSRSNTELGLAIDSPELAAEAASLLEQHWVSSNYRLRIGNGSERIEWIAAEDDGEVVHAAEPHTDWLLRFRLGLLSMFVSEDLL